MATTDQYQKYLDWRLNKELNDPGRDQFLFGGGGLLGMGGLGGFTQSPEQIQKTKDEAKQRYADDYRYRNNVGAMSSQQLSDLEKEMRGNVDYQADVSSQRQDEQDAKAKALEQKQQAYADTIKQKSDEFSKNLPGYIEKQVGSAQDLTKGALQQDLLKNKQVSNQRGLLYSGVKDEADSYSKAQRGGQLASQIQGINQSAADQDQMYRDNALAAQSGADVTSLQNSQMKAQQAQSNYQTALQQQQAQNSFWGSLFGGIGGILGGLIGLG